MHPHTAGLNTRKQGASSPPRKAPDKPAVCYTAFPCPYELVWFAFLYLKFHLVTCNINKRNCSQKCTKGSCCRILSHEAVAAIPVQIALLGTRMSRVLPLEVCHRSEVFCQINRKRIFKKVSGWGFIVLTGSGC